MRIRIGLIVTLCLSLGIVAFGEEARWKELNEQGAKLYRQGKYADAEKVAQRALNVAEKTFPTNHPTVAIALNNLAFLYEAQGKYAEAEPLYKRALAILEKALGKNHPNVANSLGGLAGLYSDQGKYSEAEPLFKRALTIFEKALGKNHPDVGTALGNLGVLYAHKGERRRALEMFEQVLAIRTKKGLPTEWPKNLMADAYLDRNDLVRAAPLIKESGNFPTRGRFYLLSSNYEKAAANYDQLRTWAERNRDADALFTAYTGLGRAYEGLGKDAKAAEYYRKAVDFTEALRSSLSRQAREKFFDVRVYGFYRTAPYEGLARVLIRLNRPVDALKSSEYSKARVYSEQISSLIAGDRLDVPQGMITKDESLNDQLAAIKKARQKAYKDANKERIKALEPQVKELEDKLDAHIKMLRNKYPLFAVTRYPEPMELSQSALKDNEWTLSYDVTDSGVIIYLTKGKKLVKALFKPTARKELDELVRKVREPLEVSEGNFVKKLKSFDFASGKKLSDLLLSDMLSDLPEGIPVIIVPDDSLGVLPFEMLVLNDGGEVRTDKKIPYVTGARFFGDRNPLSYYQSITALTLARTFGKAKRSAPNRMVMADPVFDVKDSRLASANRQRRIAIMKSMPDKLLSIKNEMGLTFLRLPLTGELAKSLKQLDSKKTDLYTGMKASKPVLFEKPLTKYGSIVFATHGYFGKDLPGMQEPVLVLTIPDQPKGQDGFLRMSEVMGLELNSDIVALTACQTGLGRRISGEGTMGMGRAFQYAGAKAVLMTLWSVAEKSSVILTESFFRHLKEGKSKLESLRLARKEIRDAGYDHPFFWAPFILVGEVD